MININKFIRENNIDRRYPARKWFSQVLEYQEIYTTVRSSVRKNIHGQFVYRNRAKLLCFRLHDWVCIVHGRYYQKEKEGINKVINLSTLHTNIDSIKVMLEEMYPKTWESHKYLIIKSPMSESTYNNLIPSMAFIPDWAWLQFDGSNMVLDYENGIFFIADIDLTTGSKMGFNYDKFCKSLLYLQDKVD